MTGSIVSKQWPELEKCDNFLSSHFWFLDDRSWKKRQLFCLQTFTFMMTGNGKKNDELSCLHPFTFMELVFNQSQELTGIRLFLRAGIYKRARCRPAPDYTSSLPPQEVGAATFVLLPLVVIFLATQTQLFMWPFTPVVETLLPSSNEILYWHRQTYKRMLLTRESSVCHWLLWEADPSFSLSQWLDACPLAPVSLLG